MNELELRPGKAGLLIVDFQERLLSAMPQARAEHATRNCLILLETARRMSLPVIATEQYPQGLGPTIAPIRATLETLGSLALPKLEFSALGNAATLERIQSAHVSSWIVTGMETHVCVYQSVRALVSLGAAVHVVSDACLSRHDENWQRGLALAERAGAVVTTTEVVVFDLLGRAGTEDFKALSKLVR